VTTRLQLPTHDGQYAAWQVHEPAGWTRPTEPIKSRVAFAAAHVVASPWRDNYPGAPAQIDWDTTLAFRRHLWSWGLGVAEAMDTAQRGMGLDWPATRELIERSSALARETGGTIAAGAGTDHAPNDLRSLDDVVHAYLDQLAVVEGAGAIPILMASRQLARVAQGSLDYQKVYDRLLSQVSRPVILHWLGPMFDPALAGYWGSEDIAVATNTLLDVIRDHANVVDGVKVSLLDAAHEVRLRAALPAGVRLYTGDDFNYPELIRGDGARASDALLGAFAAIAPAASAALQALDAGDVDTFDSVLAPTVPLSRHVFAGPTYYYKTGITFLAWLAGHQRGFAMVGGLQSGRSPLHLVDAYRLADTAGLFEDPDLAAARMRTFLGLYGLSQ
jgi:Protein of unknown function (DUF993)